MKKTRNFSVVMATYTGIDTIDSTFKSLLDQKDPNTQYEVVVIIDGQNKPLRKTIDEVSEEFARKNIPFTTTQFSKNRGRFAARLEGANLAKHDYLLIVDDRIELPANTFKFVCSSREEAIMPDVIEKKSSNLVSLTLFNLRRKIYGKNWGNNFKPFYIDKNNFDQAPKGTAALWVSKPKFINACKEVLESGGSTKHSSDDTRVLRSVVDSGVNIYKTSELKIIYNPRNSVKDELIHLFKRGPKFVDYYLSPGRRYFNLLAGFFIILIPAIILMILYPVLMLGILILLFLVSLWLGGFSLDLPRIWLGEVLILLVFGAGLVQGLLVKILRR